MFNKAHIFRDISVSKNINLNYYPKNFLDAIQCYEESQCIIGFKMPFNTLNQIKTRGQYKNFYQKIKWGWIEKNFSM